MTYSSGHFHNSAKLLLCWPLYITNSCGRMLQAAIFLSVTFNISPALSLGLLWYPTVLFVWRLSCIRYIALFRVRTLPVPCSVLHFRKNADLVVETLVIVIIAYINEIGRTEFRKTKNKIRKNTENCELCNVRHFHKNADLLDVSPQIVKIALL